MTEHSDKFQAHFKFKSPDYARCAENVLDTNGWHSHQCSRANGHGADGAYCRQHATSAERREKRLELFRARCLLADKESLFTKEARDAVYRIAEGIANPQSLVREILARYEAKD